ncbi:hypothetical protein BO99DRAFT_219333 [Aspergillus violaceofuscus CBS 115571]|uniref:Uncharacterized protein n=1 Tax=Aspergillus violaceofuscus (strain CBS 115571) TaxID=1450538 RepID=A0A2V5GZA4_ASPV1|nr:hypothetical protein BO99DRAFT_219333 [Aspergillus violaceofuscus CBS 115571]
MKPAGDAMERRWKGEKKKYRGGEMPIETSSFAAKESDEVLSGPAKTRNGGSLVP